MGEESEANPRQTMGTKQARIEAALAKMRAKASSREESQQPPRRCLGGFVYDDETQRYYRGSVKKKKKTAKEGLPLARTALGDALKCRSPVERRRKVEAALARSRIRVIPEEEGKRPGIVSAACDGETLAMASSGTVWVNDVTFQDGTPSCVVLTQNKVCIGDAASGVVRVWEPRRLTRALPTKVGGVWCLAASESTLAAGGDRGVALIDLHVGLKSVVETSKSACLAVDLSEHRLLRGHRNGSVFLVDVRSDNYQKIATLPHAIDDVQFLSDYSILLSDRHSSIEKRDLRHTKLPVARLSGHRGHGAVASKMFADDNFCTAGGADGVIRVWRWDHSDLLAAIPCCPDDVLIAAKTKKTTATTTGSLASFLGGFPSRRFVARKTGNVYSLGFQPPRLVSRMED